MMWEVGLLGLLAEGLGVAVGILLLYLFHITNKRLIGMLFGTTSGIMVALICFDVLPHALTLGKHSIVILGVVMGICIGLLLDDITSFLETKINGIDKNKAKTGILLLLGVALHNIPEGFALGTMAVTEIETLYKFVWIVGLHSIPEAIALAIPFYTAGVSLKKMLFAALGLGGIMGAGAILGFVASSLSGNFITLALGIAGGVILYVVYGELVPESRKIWNGRMTTVATVVGILIGMLLVTA